MRLHEGPAWCISHLYRLHKRMVWHRASTNCMLFCSEFHLVHPGPVFLGDWWSWHCSELCLGALPRSLALFCRAFAGTAGSRVRLFWCATVWRVNIPRHSYRKSEPKVKREQTVISVLLFWCFFSESNIFPCRNTSVSQNLPGEHSIYSLQTGLQYGLAGASRSSSWCSLPSLPEGDSWATSGAECFLSFPWLSSAFCSYKEVTEVTEVIEVTL